MKEFESLKVLIEELSGEEADMREDFNRIFINGYDTELMLRLKHFSNSLVIARIAVRYPYQGQGTKILRWIEDYAIKHSYPSIMIESACTQAINSFAEKHGFVKDKTGAFEFEGMFVGNWIKNL